MEIKVFGSGCKKCSQLYDLVDKTLQSQNLTADLSKVEDLKEMVKNGIMKTPALTIDGKLVVSGRVPSEKDIIKLLNK